MNISSSWLRSTVHFILDNQVKDISKGKNPDDITVNTVNQLVGITYLIIANDRYIKFLDAAISRSEKHLQNVKQTKQIALEVDREAFLQNHPAILKKISSDFLSHLNSHGLEPVAEFYVHHEQTASEPLIPDDELTVNGVLVKTGPLFCHSDEMNSIDYYKEQFDIYSSAGLLVGQGGN